MDAAVRDEILDRLDRMPEGRQRDVLQAVRAMSGLRPRGAPGRDPLDLAGTLSADEAAAMTRAVEEAFERIEPDAW